MDRGPGRRWRAELDILLPEGAPPWNGPGFRMVELVHVQLEILVQVVLVGTTVPTVMVTALGCGAEEAGLREASRRKA